MSGRRHAGADGTISIVALLLLGILGLAAASCLPAVSLNPTNLSIGQKADVGGIENQHEVRPLEPPPDTMLKDCERCHRPGGAIRVTIPTAPPVAHGTEGWDHCIFCHAPGRLAPVVEGHPIVEDNVCLGCHTESLGEPPEMAHTVFQDEECTSCHEPGLTSPANHDTRASFTCVLCHEPSTIHAPEAPHALAADLTCSECHGLGNVNAYPADHADRSDSMCTKCHTWGDVVVPRIDHSIAGRDDCLLCHSVADEDKPGLQ